MLAFLLLVGTLATAIAGLMALTRRRAKRFTTQGAVADTFADLQGRFALEVPAGGALDLYVRYVLNAVRRSGGGLSYGIALRLDVERDGFLHSHEYLLGQAQRPFGEVPLAESLDAGPVIRTGELIERGLLLVRAPAGGKLSARGRIEVRGGATCEAFELFAKPSGA